MLTTFPTRLDPNGDFNLIEPAKTDTSEQTEYDEPDACQGSVKNQLVKKGELASPSFSARNYSNL
jgi:hypothetical protein